LPAGVLAGVVLVAVVVVGLTREDPKKADARAVREAGRALTSATGLTLSGSYGEGPATFTVTSAGTARGVYTFAGGQVNRIDVASATYLKARSRFWTTHGTSSAIAAEADGRWATTPNGYSDLGLMSLSPQSLGQNLLDPGVSSPVRTSLNGVPAVRLAAGGLTYLVARDRPYRVLRVQGRTATKAYSFDVTALPTPAMTAFFTALRTDVRALKDAYDPDFTFTMTGGRPHLSDCGGSGCTISGKVEPDAWNSSGAIHLVTTVAFKESTGKIVSRCSDSATVVSKLQVRFSCRTHGPAWTAWYHHSHDRLFSVRGFATFAATVNSVRDVDHLLLVLSQEQQQTS
jgi:hypothetical protein